MQGEKPKILILSCGTGEGHNSAAYAIEAGLTAENIACEVKDVLTFKSERASRRVAALYNGVITKAPKLFGLVYTLGKWYDALRLPSPVYRANAGYADKLYEYIKINGYNRIVCTHFFAMQAVTAVRRKYNLSVGCYGVMTDYTIHPFVKDSDLDGYFVPTERVARQFMRKGFARNKLHITGIPVHRKFASNVTKQSAREGLNLPQNKKIVAVMTGGSGCGKVAKLCKKLNGAFDEEYLFIVLTGRNGKLTVGLTDKFKNNNKIRVIPFTPDVHLYIKASDVVLSKSGGLSSTEISVSNVPLVHLKAIPGLETANLKYFSGNGLSLRADTVRKAVKQTKRLLSDVGCAAAMVEKQKSLINAEAAEDIIGMITEDTSNERTVLDVAYNGRFSSGEHDVLQDCSRTSEA